MKKSFLFLFALVVLNILFLSTLRAFGSVSCVSSNVTGFSVYISQATDRGYMCENGKAGMNTAGANSYMWYFGSGGWSYSCVDRFTAFQWSTTTPGSYDLRLHGANTDLQNLYTLSTVNGFWITYTLQMDWDGGGIPVIVGGIPSPFCVAPCTNGVVDVLSTVNFTTWLDYATGQGKNTNVWHTRTVCINGTEVTQTNNFSSVLGQFFVMTACRDGTWQTRRVVTGVNVYAGRGDLLLGDLQTNGTNCAMAAYFRSGGTNWNGLSSTQQASWELFGGDQGLVIDPGTMNGWLDEYGQTNYAGYVENGDGGIKSTFEQGLSGNSTNYNFSSGTNAVGSFGEVSGIEYSGGFSFSNSGMGVFEDRADAIISGVGTVVGTYSAIGSINTGSGWSTLTTDGYQLTTGTNIFGMNFGASLDLSSGWARTVSDKMRAFLVVTVYVFLFVNCVRAIPDYL